MDNDTFSRTIEEYDEQEHGTDMGTISWNGDEAEVVLSNAYRQADKVTKLDILSDVIDLLQEEYEFVRTNEKYE